MAAVTTKTPHILLLGGHGKVALHFTRKAIARSWNLTSVIRNAEHKSDIVTAAGPGPGKLNVLVESLDDVKRLEDAKRIIDNVKPDWVVWSAGAGGKGGKERTYGIDRDAAAYFIKASLATSSITKFLLVSMIGSRRTPAPWWTGEDTKEWKKLTTEILPDYYKAKIAADEVLTVLGEEKKGFEFIVLRPGTLTDEKETGKVILGKTKVGGLVTREDVAEVAAKLLEKDGVKGWFDLLNGENELAGEVDRVLKEGVDSREGEDFEVAKKNVVQLLGN